MSARARPSPRTRRRGSSPSGARSRCRSRPGSRRRRRADAMCGIVGAAARRDIVPVLIEGLQRLEYRGYDSAGIAVLSDTQKPQLSRLRAAGRVAELATQVAAQKLAARAGIAHTRWATHGAPTEANAHPHVSGSLA